MAKFALRFTKRAAQSLAELDRDQAKLKKVRRALGRLQEDPRHPGLHSHKYESLHGENGVDVWDSYVENRTPSAWGIFWHYGPEPRQITIVAITPHP